MSGSSSSDDSSSAQVDEYEVLVEYVDDNALDFLREEIATPELVEFYDARDQFIGRFGCPQNIPQAFERLKGCSFHDEARWLVELFGGVVPQDEIQALDVLRKDVGNSPAARMYVALMLPSIRTDLLWVPPQHPRSLYILATRTWEVHQLRLALSSAQQGDRLGLYLLGKCFQNGEGVVADEARAELAFLRSAQLGCANGLRSHALCATKPGTLERLVSLGIAAARGAPDGFVPLAVQAWDLWIKGNDASAAEMVFAAGRALLKGNVDLVHWKVFGERVWDMNEMRTVVFLTRAYSEWCRRACHAIESWLLCSQRLPIQKEIALVIAKMLWEGRGRDYSHMAPSIDEEVILNSPPTKKLVFRSVAFKPAPPVNDDER